MKHVIIDYGVGNLASIKNACDRIGLDTMVSSEIEDIKEATSLILPGVGAFEDAMQSLKESGLIPYILDHINRGKYLLGICLGMQLLYEESEEFGLHKGLGIFKGRIKEFDIALKVPHMGWNNLVFDQRNDPILRYIKEGDYVYFVHSFYAVSEGEEVVASTKYEVKVPAIVHKEHVYATQFHPEKSGQIGLKILKAYGELIE